jgi:hypothetical protein
MSRRSLYHQTSRDSHAGKVFREIDLTKFKGGESAEPRRNEKSFDELVTNSAP